MAVNPDLPERVRKKLDALPAEPGVYVFSDASHRVVYVGKASSLRSRVRSYFQRGAGDGRPLFRYIVDKTDDIDCIVCANEVEAVLLENNLIKKHRPRYNVRLRDDKTYISLKLTIQEEWPRVHVTRTWKNDGNLYFGPFSSAGSVREMLRVLKKFFPLRTCRNGFFKTRKRPCLEYEIGHCSAPCVDLITKEEYARWVDETTLFLRGKNDDLIPRLQERMNRLSEAREYERAAKVRDQIAAIENVFQHQRVEEVKFGDVDIFGLHRDGDVCSIHLLFSRDGKLVNSRTETFRSPLDDAEVIAGFLGQFYVEGRYVPPQVWLPIELPDRELLATWLTSKAGRKVSLHVPQRGEKKRLVEMATKNARVNSETDALKEEQRHEVAARLAEISGAADPIDSVECYDIAHLHGQLTVASRVRFENGEPVPSGYRRFKVRSVTNDDFAAMAEVLDRRFRAGTRGDSLPDLIVVDGGKGQLSSAVAIAERYGVAPPIIGLAKDRLRAGERTTERIFRPGESEPVDLAESSKASLYLQRIRDEAHRFANEFHRELRRKKALATGLEEIPGIGAKRRESLLAHFGSLKGIREATVEELAQTPGINVELATSILDFLRGGNENPVGDGIEEA